MKSTGLGDSIEKLTKKTGIKAIVEKLEDVFNFDCGCEERKNKLNKMFPYNKINCLTESEYEYLNSFDWNINQLTPHDQERLLSIYNRIFSSKQQATTCSSCWVKILDELKIVYNEYKNND